MEPERWRRLEELYHAALTRSERDRASFLAHACAGDEALLREVNALLAQPASGRGFLDGPAVAVAAMVSDIGGSTLTGKRLGAYEVHARIGAGGMGEVYRARDTKLGRDVAIKILPPHFTSDPDRLARFEREARVLASLNHPHIGAIYGLEDADGVRALVLELVDGDTLADRIARGPIPVRDTLNIARQIADALETAHEKGIVHRDLKPANIKITPDGVVKVLDFGLAKAVSSGAVTADLTQSPTLTVGGTREGVILGTAAYMSPEQARGQPVDKRTDIWAFCCVLYEMLTGRLAFGRDTVSDTVAAVIEREPDWSALPPSLSPTLKVYLRRCLEKNPRNRVHDVADIRLALEGAFDCPPTGSKKSPWRQWSVAVIAAIALAGLGATTAWLLKSGPSERPAVAQLVTRVSVRTPPLAVQERALSPAVALSPDGAHLAYVAGDGATGQLYVRRLDSFEAKPVQGADNAHGPFFSPDGKWIAFFLARN